MQNQRSLSEKEFQALRSKLNTRMGLSMSTFDRLVEEAKAEAALPDEIKHCDKGSIWEIEGSKCILVQSSPNKFDFVLLDHGERYFDAQPGKELATRIKGKDAKKIANSLKEYLDNGGKL